jgi:hypothetical protein
MSLIRGPFTIKWGDNVLTDVEALDVSHSIDSDDLTTIQGRKIEVDGGYKATAILTLLATDIAALAAVLPQHHVNNGGLMSTGETVNNADGAIDVAPGNCDPVYNNLDIIACDTPSQVFRIVNARTKIEGIEIDEKIQKIMVKFVGEGAQDEATVQFFRQGTINVVS